MWNNILSIKKCCFIWKHFLKFSHITAHPTIQQIIIQILISLSHISDEVVFIDIDFLNLIKIYVWLFFLTSRCIRYIIIDKRNSLWCESASLPTITS
jgi:hypothetical protein